LISKPRKRKVHAKLLWCFMVFTKKSGVLWLFMVFSKKLAHRHLPPTPNNTTNNHHLNHKARPVAGAGPLNDQQLLQIEGPFSNGHVDSKGARAP
jgi:hypothetical protein